MTTWAQIRLAIACALFGIAAALVTAVHADDAIQHLNLYIPQQASEVWA